MSNVSLGGRVIALLMIALAFASVALPADARSHRKKQEAPRSVKSETRIPVEAKRDPADLALDRKIKGICTGC
jgi:hypothetical protein